METTAGGSAGAGNIAAILRDLGFYQYDVQQFLHPVFRWIIPKNVCRLIVAQNPNKINLKNIKFSYFHSFHIKTERNIVILWIFSIKCQKWLGTAGEIIDIFSVL